MKNIFATLILALIVMSSFAQGINYKALVKDNNGNILANQEIDVGFQIFEPQNVNPIYIEVHPDVMTDANGIVILNIGEGETTDDFNTINWSQNGLFLNVQFDIGSGFQDMGNTTFSSVPYAIHAQNVTGLEQITENDGTTDNTGWRLSGRDPNFHGPIGPGAIDLSYSFDDTEPFGATNSYAIAMGGNTKASGTVSFAMGFGTEASAYASTAIGESTVASGTRSTALGSYTKARSLAETAIGLHNTDYSQIFTDGWIGTDRLFVIGNGQGINAESDALIVLKNGTITAPSLDISEITVEKALVTKEYLDTRTSLAYGSFNGGLGSTSTTDPDIIGGTGNFYVEREFDDNTLSYTNTYIITVPGETLSASNSVGSVIVNTSTFRSVNVTYSEGKMYVYIFGSSFSQVSSPFQFIIYKI